MKSLPGIKWQMRRADFYLQVREASMKAETRVRPTEKWDSEMMNWIRARVRLKWEGSGVSEMGERKRLHFICFDPYVAGGLVYTQI